METKSLKFSLKDKLNEGDTENQTFGCRANNPNICKNCYVENVCAFVREDNICKAPSSRWKKYYLKLREENIND